MAIMTQHIPAADTGTRKLSSLLFEGANGLLALLMLLLVLYPIGAMFVRELLPDGGVNIQAFRNVLSSSAFWEAAYNTAIVLAVSGSLSILIGTIFAWLNERTDAQMGFVSKFLPVLPLLVPSVAMSIGWIFLAQETSGFLNVFIRWLADFAGIEMRRGPLNISTWSGLIFVYTLHLVPFSYLIVSVAFRNLDPAYEEAARMSGAGRLRVFLKISSASVLPAIMNSALLVTIVGIAMYSVPVIIGSVARIDVLSVMTVNLVRGVYPPRIAEGVVISLILTAVVLGVWWLQRYMSGRQRHATIGGKAGGTSLVELGAWKWVARVLVLAFVAASTVLPFVALLLVALQPFWSPAIDVSMLSLQHFEELFQAGITKRALTTSLTLGVVGATIGMIVAAVLMEYARDRGGWRANTVLGIVRLPGAVINVVLGVGFLIVLGAPPFNLQGTALILLLAYIVIYMPQAATAAGSAIEQVGGELIESGRMAGAGKSRVFGRITLPLILPGLAAGWAMIFVVMVGDLTASALLAGTRNPVVGFVILDIWENGLYSALAALSALISMISTAAVMLVLYLGRGRLSQAGSFSGRITN
ncbi:iron ABC transporter permease [Agaricicola taiwanensis]|uniref:Iron ABC transporter permease n=1 Tax=Agaricicola taiwanensis TaxID=591372 RepID=A0A8J2YN26_9RHOB|nr:iron ABC transporter permease [Agaricicola taiwanensis]GGE54802.1 iron ABC transporter permease [Agaricicola taiwanensis]